MSLEAKIEALTNAVLNLSATLNARQVLDTKPVSESPTPVAQNHAQTTPVNQPTPQPAPISSLSQPVAAPAAAMPPPPSFAPPQPAPVAAPQQTGAPFNDIKGLIAYAMETYKAIGPQKGAGIQNILQGLGYSNINSVTPEHFGQFYAAVEGLKA